MIEGKSVENIMIDSCIKAGIDPETGLKFEVVAKMYQEIKDSMELARTKIDKSLLIFGTKEK